LRFLALWSDETRFEKSGDIEVQALIIALIDIWDDLTFEDVQAVFLDWMEKLCAVINNNGEY
jgi:hypothetical protein